MIGGYGSDLVRASMTSSLILFKQVFYLVAFSQNLRREEDDAGQTSDGHFLSADGIWEAGIRRLEVEDDIERRRTESSTQDCR